MCILLCWNYYFETDEPLEIIKELHNIETIEGETVNFVCEVSKLDAVATWAYNGKTITVKGGYDIKVDGRVHILNLEGVEVEDAGKYVVKFDDKMSTAELKVKGNHEKPATSFFLI